MHLDPASMADNLRAEIEATTARLADLKDAYRVMRNLGGGRAPAPVRISRRAPAPAETVTDRRRRGPNRTPLPGGFGGKRGPHPNGPMMAVLDVCNDGGWHGTEEFLRAGVSSRSLWGTLDYMVKKKKTLIKKGNAGAAQYRLADVRNAGKPLTSGSAPTQADRILTANRRWQPTFGEVARGDVGAIEHRHGGTRDMILARLSTTEWKKARDVVDTRISRETSALSHMVRKTHEVEVRGLHGAFEYRLKEKPNASTAKTESGT